MAATFFSVSAMVVSASFWPAGRRFGHQFLGSLGDSGRFEKDSLFGLSQLGLHLGGGCLLGASQGEFVGHVSFLDRLSHFLGNIDMADKSVEQADVLFLEDFVEGSVHVGLELLAAVADQQLDGPEFRAVIAANAFALRNDHFLLDGVDIAETADDVRGLPRHDAPDGAEVHVDLEPVAGGKTDARIGDRLLFAAFVEARLCRSRPSSSRWKAPWH